MNYQWLGRAIGRRPLRDFYTGEIRFQLIDKAYYSLCLNYKVNIFAVKDGWGRGQGSIRTRLGRLTSYDDGTSFGDGGEFINEVRWRTSVYLLRVIKCDYIGFKRSIKSICKGILKQILSWLVVEPRITIEDVGELVSVKDVLGNDRFE